MSALEVSPFQGIAIQIDIYLLTYLLYYKVRQNTTGVEVVICFEMCCCIMVTSQCNSTYYNQNLSHHFQFFERICEPTSCVFFCAFLAITVWL